MAKGDNSVAGISVYGWPFSEPAWSGALNMAADEWLLERAIAEQRTFLRFYRWEGATVSLGHFQATDATSLTDLPASERFAELPWVRRLSGGGAILHHHEWTYSCVVPPGHRYSHAPRALYGVIHEPLIAWLRGMGCDAELRGETQAEREGQFLCFQRGDAQDIVIGPHKVVGSAQRRRKGGVLQHGSILLKASEYAPEFPGALDLGGNSETVSEGVEKLARALVAALAGEDSATVQVVEFTRAERDAIAEWSVRYRLR